MIKKLFLLALTFILSINTNQAQTKKIFYIDEDPREIRVMDAGGANDALFFKKTENLYPKYITASNTTQEIFFVGSNSGYRIYKKGMNGLGEEVIHTAAGSIYELEIDEANAKIYWTETDNLRRANLDGSNVETLKTSAGTTFRGIAISGSFLYWTERTYTAPNNTTTLYRAALDATGPIIVHTETYNSSTTSASALGSVYGLDIDATNGQVYWADLSADGVYRKNSDGTGAVTTLYTTPSFSPRALALDVPNNKMYWANTQSGTDALQMANLDGTGVTSVNASMDDPRGVDVAVVNPINVGLSEIDIQSSNSSIANNDITPSIFDNTDFGNVALNNNYKDHYYFIRNLGGIPLTLSGTPKVVISGANAADFTLQTDATSPITAVSNSSFVVRFDPSVLGTRTATITINSDDVDEPIYTFNIQGEGSVSSGETGTNDIRITTHTTGQSLDNEDPGIAYDPISDRYLVVFEKEIINSDEEIFGQFINNEGILIGSEFRISVTGPESNTDHDAADPKIVFNPITNQFMVVWRADDVVNGDTEVYGQLINANGSLVNGLGNEIRISQNGTDGVTTAYVSTPEISVNTTNGEYFAIWQANVTPAISDYNIYGQRLSSAGVLVGGLGAEIQLSQSGTSTQYASTPSIAYNSTSDDYLIAYHADFPNNGDNNIWSRIVDATGTVGALTQITNVGASRDADNARVTHNPILNEYFIIYQSDHINTDNEEEIFGQRLNVTGALIGGATQVSFAGIDGDGEETSSYSDVVYNATHQQILVTFQSEEPGSAAWDIFATTFDASNYAILETQSRVSDMGNTNGSTTYTATKPKQAYNSTDGSYFIVWEGDDNTPGDGEDEIFGQKWQSPPTAEIDIQGNSISIIDGDITPATNDNTDFGAVETGNTIIKSFTIFSTNTEQLVLNGATTIDITGANAADFSVTSAPSTAINPGDSSTFEITFTATTIGTRNASITIANNDVGEGTYSFNIRAESTVILNTEENSLLNTLSKIFPNPNNGSFTLNYSGKEQLKELQVTNILGKRIQTIALDGFTNSKKINLKTLAKGMYFIIIQSENAKVVKQIIIE